MNTPSNYVLGHSTHEYERLMFQSRLLRPYTEKYFRTAGIVPGMRVLDLGSGMGDVALLAGDIVGPGGRVVGLDRDAKALERARERATEQGCSSWVSFQATNLEDFTTTELFDAVVGRYILLYQPDAGKTIRQLTRFLKPGGVVVFHELDFPDPHSSYPPCEMFDQVYELVGEAFRRAGAPPDFGRRVGKAFLDAGLPFPTMLAESVVGGGRGSFVFAWIANTFISVAPRLKDLGLELPPGVLADQHLAGKIEEAAIAAGSQILGPTQYGAWTRKPL
ncbi:MAG: class I SAM-dependent methyltransferase [Pseudomonadota bacterium]